MMAEWRQLGTLTMVSVTDIQSDAVELFEEFEISFYSDPMDAVFKAVRVE
jgi:predicted ATP-dependent Lon-type protease